MTLSEQFQRDRFIEIRGFLEDPLLYVVYRYALLRAESGVGVAEDPQFSATPSFYADPIASAEPTTNHRRADVAIVA